MTYSDLNAEFNNILNNPGSLICPIGFHLTFTDATYDIGASGATRPRDLFLSRNAVIGGTLNVTGTITGTTSGNLVSGGALGTPSSGTLTSCSGLPAAGVSGTALVSADIGVSVQAYDADTLKADTTDVLTAGFAATPYDAGTKSSGTFTPDEANGNQQYCVNGGAFTLAPPTNSTSILLEVLNNASAGAITTSGFTKVVGSFDTTNTNKFACVVIKTKNYSLLQIQALQ